jgi:hypothetical protein
VKQPQMNALGTLSHEGCSHRAPRLGLGLPPAPA